MKKIFALCFAMVMSFSLLACGVPEEKLTQVDTLISEMDVLIADTETELEKTNDTGYEDVQEYYDTNVTVVAEVRTAFEEVKTNWTDNKDSLSEEDVDAAIVSLQDLKTQVEDLKQNAVDEVAQITDAIATAEAVEAEAEAGALANMDIYEVPDIEMTGWQLAGGITDGQELSDEDYAALKEQLGGEAALIFDTDGIAHFQAGDTVLDGTYEIAADNSSVTVYLPNDTVYVCMFTDMGGSTVLVALTDETCNNAGYYVQISEE